MSSVSVSCCQPPASSIAVAAPDAGRAVEIEKQAAAEARRMLDHEMAVEQNRFHFGERRIIAIDVAPARLHHRQLGIDEIRHRAAQKIRRRNKIRVENRDEFAFA